MAGLHAFREQTRVGEEWTLMRGDPGDVRTLAMLLGVQFRREPSGDFSHTNLITVLDAGGGGRPSTDGTPGRFIGIE
ncbi:MAG: hypothetical protein J6386_03460 [Candidatus Synoicihabitans palmerolidicus]|nr:hypothetical protein [Candidatus Synoicihabitans palmerolidicus]